MLPSDPTLDDVRNVVCNQGKRPLMQPSWYENDVSVIFLYDVTRDPFLVTSPLILYDPIRIYANVFTYIFT